MKKLIQVFWDYNNDCWLQSKEDVQKLGTILSERYISMAGRIDYVILLNN